ncbi:MAG: S8 family serine peptidase, partial [Thermoplasmata archaeon]|nr:S8 family serine peptidase [Thermoplasmata archaeon]
MNGYSFDTRDAEPSFAGELSMGGYPSGSAGHYIMQFVGPIKEDWKDSVRSMGVQIGDYVPNNAFIVQMNPESRERISELDFVQWTGLFQPAYKIRPELLEKTDEFEVEIVTYEGMGIAAVLDRLTDDQVISSYAGTDFGLVKATIDGRLLRDIARMENVRYIEPLYEPELTNENMQWIHQTYVTDYRKMWDNGLDGTGQLIAYADTGLDFDHNFFRETAGLVVTGDIYNVTDLNRRKLVRYMPMSNWTGVDPFGGIDEWALKDSAPGTGMTSGHGTMVAGTGAGRDDDVGGASPHDGLAKGAKIYMQDIGTVCRPQPGDPWDDCLRYIPDDYHFMYIYPS